MGIAIFSFYHKCSKKRKQGESQLLPAGPTKRMSESYWTDYISPRFKKSYVLCFSFFTGHTKPEQNNFNYFHTPPSTIHHPSSIVDHRLQARKYHLCQLTTRLSRQRNLIAHNIRIIMNGDMSHGHTASVQPNTSDDTTPTSMSTSTSMPVSTDLNHLSVEELLHAIQNEERKITSFLQTIDHIHRSRTVMSQRGQEISSTHTMVNVNANVNSSLSIPEGTKSIIPLPHLVQLPSAPTASGISASGTYTTELLPELEQRDKIQQSPTAPEELNRFIDEQSHQAEDSAAIGLVRQRQIQRQQQRQHVHDESETISALLKLSGRSRLGL